MLIYIDFQIDFDLSELTSLEVIAKRPKVKALLSSETTRLKQLKTELLSKLKEQTRGESSAAVGTGDATASSQSVATVVVNNYMWDQNNDFIKIYIEIEKNYSLDSTQIQMNFPNKRSFSIVFGKFKFIISRLFDDIEADKSYHKLTKTGKLIIYLKKSSTKHWTSINEVENKFKKSLEEDKDELSGDPSDPSAGLMKLMVRTISKMIICQIIWTYDVIPEETNVRRGRRRHEEDYRQVVV